MGSWLVLLVWGQLLNTVRSGLHEGTMFYGCFESGDSQVQLHWDGDQIVYADFKNQKMVWTVPLLEEQSEMFPGTYTVAVVSRERICHVYLPTAMKHDRSPTVTQAPTLLLYPSKEAEPGEETTLYCYIRHFYPPHVDVMWTKNGDQVTEGVALSNLVPETDGTFSQLASLAIRPQRGDVLGCRVQHEGLSWPANTTWALPEETVHSSAAWICLSLGLICLTIGLVLFMLSLRRYLSNGVV